jgi:hypothetical protein
VERGGDGSRFRTGLLHRFYAKGDSAIIDSAIDRYGEESKYYAQSQGFSERSRDGRSSRRLCEQRKETALTIPDRGFFQKVANTPAFERVKR